MQRDETKSSRIMRLYGKGAYTVKEIAEIVGCRPEYVRVVARQRKGSGQSDADRRYEASDLGRQSRKRRKERKREAIKAYQRTFYRTRDRGKARAAYREASHA